jgi:DNA-binding beta-propeller fold protein YncE
VAALSARYRFSLANAVQLLRDAGILRQREHDDEDEEAETAEEEEAEEEDDDEGAIIPMPGQDLVSVGAMVVGSGVRGFQDGAAAAAMFTRISAMLRLPSGRVLVTDSFNNRIRVLSADLQQVSTVAGNGEEGHRDGASAQAQFNRPFGLAVLPGGRVLVSDLLNHRVRMLSADLQQVSTVAGNGGEGHRDGAAAQAQFNWPSDLAVLPGGRVLFSDFLNNRIRVLSADMQQVSTVAGDGGEGHRDGASAQAQFNRPTVLAVLLGGRVLVSDAFNNRIRVLSADLQQVSTVAGNGGEGHRDGTAAHAQFHRPSSLTVLPDGRVLVGDGQHTRLRVLSADLQQVSTLTNLDELHVFSALKLLPDGRLLVGGGSRIRVLEGFPAAVLSTKPSHKPPKKKNPKKKKRALAGGASSSGLVPKRSRSGASSSSAAAAAAASSSDSEGEEQPGGSAAEAEPLV